MYKKWHEYRSRFKKKKKEKKNYYHSHVFNRYRLPYLYEDYKVLKFNAIFNNFINQHRSVPSDFDILKASMVQYPDDFNGVIFNQTLILDIVKISQKWETCLWLKIMVPNGSWHPTWTTTQRGTFTSNLCPKSRLWKWKTSFQRSTQVKTTI